MNKRLVIYLVSGSLLAAGAGALTAVAVGAGGSSPPGRTETVNLKNGATGPAGPTGPKGPAGDFSCPSGFSPGTLIINHPGGHVTTYTCLEDLP